MKTVADLRERLQELHQRTQETPLFNPVFQLSHDLSHELEANEIDLGTFGHMIAELECEALKSRAVRLRRLVCEKRDTSGLVEEKKDFDAFRARWERPQLHAVFTAHPTFLLTPAQSAVVAASAASDADIGEEVCVAPHERPAITLDHEHERAMRAIGHAQDARDGITAQLLNTARECWPDDWQAFAPLPFRFASWVGYDMDGRTDIKWYTSIQYRLSEKAQRLTRYTAQLEAIDADHELLETLRPATEYAQARANDFAADLSDPADLSNAANTLTAQDPHKLLSLKPIIDALEGEANSADAERAIALKVLAAAMRADGHGLDPLPRELAPAAQRHSPTHRS